MSNINDYNYEKIDIPYNNLLERSVNEENSTTNSMLTNNETNNSDSEKNTEYSENQIYENMWISTWIKSKNYKPKSYGFLIDGIKGYIEAMDLYVKGSIVGGSVDVPNQVNADSFHISSEGDTWWGCNNEDFEDDIDNASAYVLGDGTAKFDNITITSGSVYWTAISGASKPEDGATVGAKIGVNLKDIGNTILYDNDVKNIETMVCGEDIAAKKVVCIKNEAKTDFITISKDADVSQANADTNYGEEVTMTVGVPDGSSKYVFVYVPTTGAPSVKRIISVKLKLYISSLSLSTGTVTTGIQTADTSWVDTTITWNNKPSTTDELATYFSSNSKTIVTADGGSYIEFDITGIFKYWQDAGLTNNGLCLLGGFVSGDYVTFDSSEGTNPPLLEILALGYSDGEAYLADSTDYNLCRTIVGFSQTGDTTGNNIIVQKFGKMDLSQSSYGSRLYLTDNGDFVTDDVGNYSRRVSLGTVISDDTEETEVQIQRNGFVVAGGSGSTPNTDTRYYAIGDVSYALISMTVTGSTYEGKQVDITLHKNGRSSYTVTAGAGNTVTVQWNSAKEYIYFTFSGSGAATVHSITYIN